VEVDLADPVAGAVVGGQHGRVGVCLLAPALRLGGAGGPAEFGRLDGDLGQPGRIGVPGDAFGERPIGAVDIVADQWRYLVRHHVSGGCRGS
jgi:hypothetical protein